MLIVVLREKWPHNQSLNGYDRTVRLYGDHEPKSILVYLYMAFTTMLLLPFLYLTFRAKQFVCDFLLQNDWMALNKGAPGMAGYVPLALHAGIHGFATFVIMLAFAPGLWWLGVVDFVVHGAVDRTKGVISRKHGWNTQDRWFWWSFGLDQEAHNLTHFIYICLVALAQGWL